MSNVEKRIHIRVNSELHSKIKEKASKENRTLSNYIINLIKKDLEGNKRFEIKRWDNDYKEYTNSIYVDTEEEIAEYYEQCRNYGYKNNLMIIDKADNSISYYN